jgi:hypothetical protein
MVAKNPHHGLSSSWTTREADRMAQPKSDDFRTGKVDELTLSLRPMAQEPREPLEQVPDSKVNEPRFLMFRAGEKWMSHLEEKE